MRIKVLIALLLLASTLTAKAQQFVEVSGDGLIRGELSAVGITRLHFVKDEVASVQLNEGGHHIDVSFTKEPTTGDLYIKLPNYNRDSSVSTKVSFFLITKRGYTYQFELEIHERTSAQIAVRNLNIKHLNQEVKQANQVRESSVIRLIRAMSTGTLIEGYRVKNAFAGTQALGSLKFETRMIYQGKHLTGQIIVIRNTTRGEVTIKETRFLSSGILAVTILGNPKLGTLETRKVLLIGQTNGDSLL